MSLDTRYIPAFNLQKEIIDKNSGFSLAGGKVYFYKDTARTTLKKIYQISGTPPDYTYVELPNPITLSSVGTFQNATGDDVVVYYYPYDSEGKIELYFVKVESATAEEQFTREGQPNIADELETVADVTNYIPNGQFLDHADGVIDITEPYTQIARGNWFFQRSIGSLATDRVSFILNNEYTENPTTSPRYLLQIECINPHVGDTTKDLHLHFYDVNKFASASQKYTYYFEAKSESGATIPVTLNRVKVFGSGGSPEQISQIASFEVEPGSFQKFQTTFTFGTNEGKIISENGDDDVILALLFPPDATFKIRLANFVLTQGEILIPNFPAITNQQMIYRSEFIELDFLDKTGNNLYLPIIQTKNGLTFDHSVVGQVSAFPDNTARPGFLECVGSYHFKTGVQPSSGIPYSRLAAYLWDGVRRIYVYGSGQDDMSVFNTNNNQLIISNNNVGVVTATSDGTIPTGFTFETVHSGVSSGYEIKAYTHKGEGFYIITDNFGVVQGTTSSPQGPYFYTPISTIPGAVTPPPGFGRNFEEFATSDTPLIDQLTAVAGSSITAGDYGIFVVDPGAAPLYGTSPTRFGYWWYKVDGSGTDPALGLKYNIPINVRSTDSQHEIAEKTRMALNGWQVSRIVTTAASAITAGSYFNIYTTSTAFYVWYEKDGSGTDPAIGGKTGIKVSILNTDTAIQVAEKTQIAINERQFAVPDFRGQFLRGVSGTSSNDPDKLNRFSLVPGIFGNRGATMEISKNKTHLHRVWENNPGGGTPTATAKIEAYVTNQYLNMLGGDRALESRPPNTTVYYFIHL
jgi:hypothetical protein